MATVEKLAGWISEVLAHHMLEVVDDVVVVTNGDDRVVLVSRSGAALGWSRTVMIGSSWDDIERSDGRAAGRSPMPGPAGIAERRRTALRRGDGSWVDADIVRYSTHIADVGPASVIVVTPVPDAADNGV